MGQIVLMRELIVVFNGNEISLGLMLACWLLWTAIGSSLCSRLWLGTNNSERVVALFECLLGVGLLPTIWVVRASRAWFQTVPSELLGPVPMLITSLVCLSAFCLLSGGLFVVATRLYGETVGASSRVASSSAYLLESAGSALGGILASVLLLRLLDSFAIASVVLLLNFCMAAVLLFRRHTSQFVATALVGIFVVGPLFVYVAPWLRKSSQARAWRGFHLVDSRDSVYGNLAVIQTGDLRSVYDNGVILATAPDEASAEEAVHYALLEHPAPKKILLIGGGINGGIGQALQHPSMESVDYVELDPMLIDVVRRFFPIEASSFSDPRVHLHYADGRQYLKMSSDLFDVIIVDFPGPQTAQLNRFYTAEFFHSARDHLAPGGLLALQLPASEDYISPELAEFLRCIQHTLRQEFAEVVAIPGPTIHFFATQRANILAGDPGTLVARLRARKIQTQYVREYFIPFRMMPDRMAEIRRVLQPLPTTPVNRDFAPVAYYFDVVLWSAQFKLSYSHWFQSAAHISFPRMMEKAVIILFLAALVIVYVPGREKRARATLAGCVAAMGFTLMALQIVLLLAFQSVFGYVYHQLAILVAMLMAGIALGSWLGLRRYGGGDRPSFRLIAMIQLLLGFSAPALIFLLSRLARASGGTTTLLAAQLAFPALALLCGLLGGYQFPLATEIYLRDHSAQSRLGVLYAVDLLGGCLGALLLSTYLIPVFGFWKTAWLSAAVNLAPALLAVRASRDVPESRA